MAGASWQPCTCYRARWRTHPPQVSIMVVPGLSPRQARGRDRPGCHLVKGVQSGADRQRCPLRGACGACVDEQPPAACGRPLARSTIRSAREAMAANVSTGPRASTRARSYHASPGACQASVLCISLWMLSVNMLVIRCTAGGRLGCGKVDNRRGITSHQVAGRRLSTGGAKYQQATCIAGAHARHPLRDKGHLPEGRRTLGRTSFGVDSRTMRDQLTEVSL
jgi:hypothetical protein